MAKTVWSLLIPGLNINSVNKGFFVAVILLITVSCKKSDQEFIMGSQFLESQSSIRRVDTFSVELSTVILDSFPTSGYGSALAGSHYDSIFGKVSCKSFFQIGIPEAYDIEDEDVYDSVKFILTNTGYSYGDTTYPITLNLCKLPDEFKAFSDGNLYNTTNINYYEDSIIGSISYIPRPNIYDSIEMPVKNDIGRELFNMMLEKNEILSSDARFLYYYLKGLALVADTGARSIINFSATTEQLKLRIYYHRYGMESEISLFTDFPMISSDLQFNQIKHDFAGTKAELLNKQRESVISSKTGNTSFLYGGVGLMTKIRFPSLNEMLLVENSIILKAELVLKPQAGTYRDFPLPSQIMMYNTDQYNNIGAVFYDYYGSVYVAAFIDDELYNDETSYTFDITSYILAELEDSNFDIEHGILISNLPENFVNTFERLVFNASDLAPLLKLYYVTY